MTKNKLAKILNGSEYPLEIDSVLLYKAKKAGLIIVYGGSDDLMEFDGAIYDEIGCYEGGESFIDRNGLLPQRDQIDDDETLKKYFIRQPNARKIEAVWCATDEYSWTYETDIPHETFDVIEVFQSNRLVDGEIQNVQVTEKYCRGIVFSLEDL